MGEVNPVKYFLSGGFGGIVQVLVGHPFDTLKVRLQTMPLPGPGEKPLYEGTVDCAKKIIKQEGIGGLYKGITAPLTAVTPIIGISFFGFGVGKRIMQGSGSAELTPLQIGGAGMFSGVFTTFVMAPGERIKCLLQIQAGGSDPPKYDGMWDCAKKLYREGGIRSIYKGFCATLLRDVPASGVYFTSYELLQMQFQPVDASGAKHSTLGSTILSGGFAGILNWCVAMPPDILKSRLQTAPEGTYPHGVRSVFANLLRDEGPLALYKGVIPVMLRAFPANAACFLGFEIAQSVLNMVF